jgi:hypothetical protein
MFWANFYAAVGFWSIALVGGLYWGRRYVRALEARGQTDARIAALESRITALEAGRSDVELLDAGSAPLREIGQRAAERVPGSS